MTKKVKRIVQKNYISDKSFTLLTPDILEEFNFNNVGPCEFDSYNNFHYWVKNGICLFYNTPIKTDYQESFLIGHAEMRQGKYYATTFKWINSEEQLIQIYEAIIGKEITK